MKKSIFIFTLIIINLMFYTQKIIPANIDKIDIKLNKDELGIIFLKLENSNSMLISLNNKNILYIINYNNDKALKENLDKFGISIDYVIMNNNYNINFGIKKIIKDKLTLNSIEFNTDRLTYNNKTFCINTSYSCDFIYYTKDYLISNENVVIFYVEEIEDKIINKTYNKWIDKYEITKDAYTILKINDTYDVYDFIK